MSPQRIKEVFVLSLPLLRAFNRYAALQPDVPRPCPYSYTAGRSSKRPGRRYPKLLVLWPEATEPA